MVFLHRRRWFKESVDPVLDKAGNLIGAVLVLADITAQKLFEKKIQEEEKISSSGRIWVKI